MSTTFGVILNAEIGETEENIEKIAFRSSNGIYFKNRIAHLLPDDFPVIPLDNTAQGIFTIGDIKKEIKKREIKKRENGK